MKKNHIFWLFHSWWNLQQLVDRCHKFFWLPINWLKSFIVSSLFSRRVQHRDRESEEPARVPQHGLGALRDWLWPQGSRARCRTRRSIRHYTGKFQTIITSLTWENSRKNVLNNNHHTCLKFQNFEVLFIFTSLVRPLFCINMDFPI